MEQNPGFTITFENASEEDCKKVLESLDELNKALGGEGIEFKKIVE